MNVPRRVKRANLRKRCFDISLVVLASPLLVVVGALAALIVLLTLGRPVLFRQARIGYSERVFTLYKFRTMSNATCADGRPLPDRERLSAAGRLIRKFSLDEIPQIFNVIRGDMSLVGPRPLYPDYLPFYRARERNRHLVRPGITGLAQISGRNGLYWDDRLAADADYVERVTLRLDVKILIRTVQQALSASGVSLVANDSGERLDVLRSYPRQGGFALRRFEFSDVPLRVALFKNPSVRQYMTLPEEVTLESTMAWARRARLDPEKRDFAVYNCDTQEVVCLLGLRERTTLGIPEMYIMVHPDMHGRGVGATSLRLLLTWMRTREEYTGCWLTVRRDNIPALALYEKAGFTQRRDPANGMDRVSMQLDWEGAR